MVATDLRYVVIRDFSPGIWSRSSNQDWPAVAGAGQASALQQEESSAANGDFTYGCYGPPMGGLVPLPQNVVTYGANDDGNSLPGGAADPYITGAILQGPMWAAATGADGGWPESGVGGAVATDSQQGYPSIDPREPYGAALRAAHPVDLHVGIEWFRTDTGRREFRWRRYKPYDAVAGVLPNGVDLHSESGAANPTSSKYGGFYLTQHRMNGWEAAASSPGIPVIVGSHIRPGYDTGAQRFCRVFPDPTVFTSMDADLTRSILSGGGQVASHQGRVVEASRYQRPQGAGFDTVQDDFFSWTKVNDDTTDANFQVFTYDRHAGIGFMQSVTATDLLLMHHEAGATLLQGDLNNPLVRRLPGVTGTGGTECIPALTSLGLVYGRNKGSVYAWQGGDESIDLAPQLQDDFWIDKDYDNKMLDLMGGFCQWGDWIITPNGWWYYIPSRAWWNVERRDEGALRYYWPMVVPKTNDLMVVKNHADGSWARAYSRLQSRSSYQWRSQPIKKTIGKLVEVREVVVTYRGCGQAGTHQFEVKIIGAQHNAAETSETKTVTVTTFADSSPRQVRIPFAYTGSAVQVQIKVDQPIGATEVPAPSIYDVAVGYSETVSIPVS